MLSEIIMFDIDDTLVNNTVVAGVLALYNVVGAEIKYDYLSMDIPDGAKQLITKLFTDDTLMSSFKPYSYMQDLVRKLSEKGHTVMCVTARPNSLSTATKKMIDEHFPEIESIVFVNGFDKRDVIRDLRITSVFEDRGETIEYLKDSNVKLFFMSNCNTPHNHAFTELHSGIVVDHIENVDEFISKNF